MIPGNREQTPGRLAITFGNRGKFFECFGRGVAVGFDLHTQTQHPGFIEERPHPCDGVLGRGVMLADLGRDQDGAARDALGDLPSEMAGIHGIKGPQPGQSVFPEERKQFRTVTRLHARKSGCLDGGHLARERPFARGAQNQGWQVKLPARYGPQDFKGDH